MRDPHAAALLPLQSHAADEYGDLSDQADYSTSKSKKGTKANSKRARKLKIGILLVCVLCCVAAVHAWAPQIDPVALAATLRSSGWVGTLLYIVGFCLGELLHVPGIIFIVAGVMVYGKFYGWLLAIVMAPLSVSTSFLVVRSIGGQPLSDNSSGWTRTILANLEERPYTTIVVVRLFTFLAPGVNYALALTSVPFRTFFLASATGLFLPLTFVVWMLEHVMGFLGFDIKSLDVPAAGGYPPLAPFLDQLEAERNLTHDEVFSSFRK